MGYEPEHWHDICQELREQLIEKDKKIQILEERIVGMGEENKRLFLSNIFMKDELEKIKLDKWWY